MKNKLIKLKNNFIRYIKKKPKLFAICVLIFIIIIAIVSIVIKYNKSRLFAINHIYDIYPKEVRSLYSNMVNISCGGDLHFDIELDAEATKVTDINKQNLLDYLFSNLEKSGQLNNKLTTTIISNKTKALFNGNIDLLSEINGYQYGNYIYTITDNEIIKKESKCNNDNNYITYLYGYSYNVDELSVDVNIGYLKDDILYDLNNNKLGKYNGNLEEMFDIFKSYSFYRLNYVRKNNILKLDSVMLIGR